jgi:hypothetical protein
MSRNLDLLQAAYQRAGRDGVDAVVDLLDAYVEWLATEPGPWDCHDREQVLDTFRRQYDHGIQADFGQPIEAGDKVILDVRPYRRDEHGNKTPGQRLWQVLTMQGARSSGSRTTPTRPPPSTRPAYPPARKPSLRTRSSSPALIGPLGGVVRPRPSGAFARLIHRRVRALGRPSPVPPTAAF